MPIEVISCAENPPDGSASSIRMATFRPAYAVVVGTVTATEQFTSPQTPNERRSPISGRAIPCGRVTTGERGLAASVRSALRSRSWKSTPGTGDLPGAAAGTDAAAAPRDRQRYE